MRKLIFAGLILFHSIWAYSQISNERISIELRYPLPLGHNFIHKAGYVGLFDIGVGYSLIKSNGLSLGVVLSSSALRFDLTDLNLFVISPKFKAEYEIILNKLTIIPQIGIGYSNWRFRAPGIMYTDEMGNQVQDENFKINYNGLTAKAATRILINNDKNLKWYFNMAYEFTRLERPENLISNFAYNQNIQLFYPGIGVAWIFGR
jgi:hypothetical protein